jgi:signal transduction histidine kinase
MPARLALLPVFNVLPGAFLLLTPELVIEAASDSYLAVSLLPREQLIGRALFELFPDNPAVPEIHGERNLRASFARVLATGQPHEMAQQRYDVPDPTAPGQFLERHWLISNSAVRDEAGQVQHLLHAVVDMTTQAQAETRLRASEAREQAARTEAERQRGELQRIFELAPVAIAVYRGPRYVIELANSLVCTLWGRTQAQAVGTPLFELLPEVAGMGYEELLAGVLATGEPHVAHEMPSTIYRRGRHETVYWNFVYLPVPAEVDRPPGVMVVATEVTEQVLAREQVQHLNRQLEALNAALHTSNEELLTNQEEVLRVQQHLEHRVAERTQQLAAALQEAQEQRTHAASQQRLLDRILGQVPAFIATLSGPEHRFTFFNDGYQRLTGGRARLGQPAAEILPEVVAQGFIDLLDGVYATGQPFESQSMPVQLLDPATSQEKLLYIDFTYQPLTDAQGHTQGILAFIVDVTDKVLARQQVQLLNQELATINEELRASNEELNATNAQLTRTNVDLDNFVYTASHDLKSPIANIEGLLLALREHLPALAPPVPRLLDLMQESTERFRLTIAQLTDIARLQQAHSQPAENVQLTTVVEAVRLDLTGLFAAAGAALTVEVPPDLHVSFAPQNLRSLIYNLLSNAVKYRDPARPAAVALRAARGPAGVTLTVQDNGLGLSEFQQTQLFGIFRRLHAHVEGSGIGLYMVKRMVENAGGTIGVASQPGVGSTFTVEIPG